MAIALHKKREIYFHMAFWAVYVSFIISHISSYQTGPQMHWGRVLEATAISVLYVMSLSYVNYFYLIPAFLIRKRIGLFIATFIAAFGLITLLRAGIENWAFGGSWQTRSKATLQVVIQSTVSDLFIILFIGLLRFASDWLEVDARRRELETEKLNAELKFLKAQVNPHFLFNTLNNLYYLATIQSSATPLVISKLSEVMRYMIYDSNHEKIDLTKEIEYMRHYISLERLRLKDEIPVEFEVSGDTHIMISPLILVAFLENAFKHGISPNRENCWIRAWLEVSGNHLKYTVANSKVKTAVFPEDGEGIGLNNVRRRLDLSYPGRHNLVIEDKETSYQITLTINRP